MEPSKINNTHSKDENINEEDKVANKVNTVTLNDFSDGDSGVYEDIILNQTHGLCPECNQPNTSLNWCKECNSKRFQQNFGNWTSGNECIDKLIQESQLNARNNFELLEWIPYNRLRHIQFLAQGGFSTVYKGLWLDGLIEQWDYEKQDWKRTMYKDENYHCNSENYGFLVAIKSLNDSANITEDFLNEWKLYLKCQHKVGSEGSYIIPVLGITQHPDTLNYMAIIYLLPGNLRNNLPGIKYNPNDKFRILFAISIVLEAIHDSDLVHGDFHSGNILYAGKGIAYTSDLGLCGPVNRSNTKDEIYGVLPYMAPEVLRGNPYTKAADIYSLGIIMWELASGTPAFYNVSYDFQLHLDICEGIRPKIAEGTVLEYVEFMKRCWDNDPKKRQTASECKFKFAIWLFKYPPENDDEKRVPIPENEPKITYHPNSCYASRKITYSAKLNEHLAQDLLSYKIIIDDDEINENFDDCKI
ncbi:kinase-like domain-containing protein [Rhizophagus irregularis DAOM 181602=DAOM 197198]|uniref:Kinase-like domain-containing protein n=1 Tax=Rhizophagus irregularis (strain DAOM 181602 / DAOM 197198 / MUCL 43194) TaxID=747089 RepID=A0A2H5RXS7_RHIID|nr:kinase-like domain-containing protein [Rhizophagus irregularis DAOM 181602=DAOM 197198]POG63267.1 kinase-like domain-containing protein [Rhizophagus irregularis DAOM 181602=DAOM 197198]GBC22896.1 kinase-like domain-containing protein [Rhizophagus irregularis DAOM 181602=DAOM 197198]|eukprot:XP_025170133.1 kinase-like domain-containing protein [Rhizophagus irregularis DAOM 181602=DAOM 197198]